MARNHWRQVDGEWQAVAFTAEEEAQADRDAAAAVADEAARVVLDANDRTIRDRLEQALANLETANTNWSTLTAAQKDAATRAAVRSAAGLIRLTLRRLDNPG